MAYRKPLLTLCLGVLALSAASAVLADEDVCKDRIAEAVAPHKADKLAAIKKIQTAQEDLQTCQSEFKLVQASLHDKVTALKTKIQELESQLAEAVAKATRATKPDLPTIAVALVNMVKEGAVGAYHETLAIAKELQQGKTTRLSGAVSGGLANLKLATSATWGFIATEADEHLPPAVKKQISEAATKVQGLWKQHVSSAAWAQPIVAQLTRVNAEVTRVVTHAVHTTPALKPLADPVTIQLLVYAIFGGPVLLTFLLPFALAGGRKPAAGGEAAGRGGIAPRKAKKGPKGRA